MVGNKMNKEDFSLHQQGIFNKCIELRKAGQKEYAGGEDAFGNFNRQAKKRNVDRKLVLMIHMDKHLDGIDAYLNGHKSQRESVHGRIQDAIVYLTLLDGMIAEEEINKDAEDKLSQISATTRMVTGTPHYDLKEGRGISSGMGGMDDR